MQTFKNRIARRAVLGALVSLVRLFPLGAQLPTRQLGDASLHVEPPHVAAQSVPSLGNVGEEPSLWRSPHMKVAGVLAVAALAAAPFDARWTPALQSPRFQGNAPLRTTANVLRTLGDPGALLLSASVFAAGRLAQRQGLADAGWHATEATVAGGLATLALKALIGRQRANAGAGPDADDFRFVQGFRSGNASMPSGHTTVAFAAAAAFGSELSRTHPKAARIATPILYTTAAGVGLSRLYNNAHWASDAINAAAVGQLVGRSVVAIAHRAGAPRHNVGPLRGAHARATLPMRDKIGNAVSVRGASSLRVDLTCRTASVNWQ